MEKSKLPYSLLLDPVTNRAAAYTNNHQPIVEEASKALVEYAAAHVANSAPFDKRAHADGSPRWRPLPAWATPDVLDRCVIVWIKRPSGEDPDEAWLAIPPR